ncbi:putative salicylate hydroxylase [Aspergillus affinis]|uniref:putative salicylate hydroxylase n=1 Tax=Aspergillus affinis TaxID=1070780 RepID=UPI0022FE1AD2|nr:putative salicylate hydroxylase [Aspergillus affinis]KAI9037181.1 putative salicylate hydroxylase [Aspergillus affinis]
MTLNIAIVGAGIGGLTAAATLRKAGHHVEIYEKSHFSTELGAALVVAPNGIRVLRILNFSFENARSTPKSVFELRDGPGFVRVGAVDLHDAEERFGAPLYTMQRRDLHAELLRIVNTSITTTDIATDSINEGVSTEPEHEGEVKIHRGRKVISADAERGILYFEDGASVTADLIIAADGLHSVLKSVVLKDEVESPAKTGFSAFRFQIPTEHLIGDERFQDLVKIKGNGPSVLANTRDQETMEHMVWYDCQNGEMQNFVGIHNRFESEDDDYKTMMLQRFGHFHPSLVHVLSKAPNVTIWPLNIFAPVPRWNRGKILLIGDAAHPMLPFSGQGANQAIEDAGALGYLFDGVHSANEIPTRIALFEKVRRLRVSRTQLMSSVRVGKEGEIQTELRQYADPPGTDVPQTFSERLAHDFGFNVFDKCREALRDHEALLVSERVPKGDESFAYKNTNYAAYGQETAA